MPGKSSRTRSTSPSQILSSRERSTSQEGPMWTKISDSVDEIDIRVSNLKHNLDKNGLRLRHFEKKFEEDKKTNNVLDACGVVSISKQGGALLECNVGEKPKRKSSALGNRGYMVFCIGYMVLLMLSFFDLVPVFEFEKISLEEWLATRDWVALHSSYPVILCGVYFVTIFGIQDYLRDEKPFDLRYPLAIWSALLAVFSVVGSLRTVPALIDTLMNRGVDHFLCGDSRFDWLIQKPAGFWTYLFILSKVPELVDTLFIVLRKKQLITLHWWHHITVLLFCWHSWATVCMNGLIFSAMNLTVHAFMYTFYTFAAMGYRPTGFAQYITIIQILQMVVGTAVTLYVVRRNVGENVEFTLDTHWDVKSPLELTDSSCKVHPTNGLAGLAMYGSYLYLFSMFFYFAYIKRK